MINSYHVETVVISCKGLDMSFGVTDSNENDCRIKQAMLGCAQRRILALDTEKMDKKSFIRICELSDIDMIVTDSEPSTAWLSFCEENDIEMIY